ncbi:hypothetical protein [Micromonospora tarensis]|uniref:MspA protein n=1 Tax=Micromonospora tarensis TaxID=2806100 RepID=A0ABS1YJN3_9ACTN|nr:hypothetical protein [Micromonospora tarensis]MBM0277366.1 hypothetical protein [Micromonospora tarensis]
MAIVLAVGNGASATAAPAQKQEIELLGFGSVLTLDGKPTSIGGVSTMAVFPPSGSHSFTPQAPYWSFGDANGSGAEQINYGIMSEAWGYQISPALRAIIVGNVTENANLYCGASPVHNYGPHNVPSGYQFHGSLSGLQTSCIYRTVVSINFRHANGSGNLNVQWNWRITWVL